MAGAVAGRGAQARAPHGSAVGCKIFAVLMLIHFPRRFLIVRETTHISEAKALAFWSAESPLRFVTLRAPRQMCASACGIKHIRASNSDFSFSIEQNRRARGGPWEREAGKHEGPGAGQAHRQRLAPFGPRGRVRGGRWGGTAPSLHKAPRGPARPARSRGLIRPP